METEEEIIFEPKLGDTFGLEKYQIYQDLALKQDFMIIELEPIIEANTDMEDNIIRQYQLVSKPKPTYIEQRQQAYPSITEQLDMIYWDKINNTKIWQETITAIKAQFPKPLAEESNDR